MPASEYQALLLVAFGGPEGPADVLPFLENVLRGRNVPRQRMLAVAEHYRGFGGTSPINSQNRALISSSPIFQRISMFGSSAAAMPSRARALDELFSRRVYKPTCAANNSALGPVV